MTFLSRHDWIYAVILFCAVVAFGNGIHYLIFRVVRNRQSPARRGRMGVREYMERPARAVLFTVGLLIVLPMVPKITPLLRGSITQLVSSLLVLFLGWLAIGAVYVAQKYLLLHFDTAVADNLHARRIHTQINYFRRILVGILVALDAGALIWNLHDQALWKYGTGLLASAGLASVVLALAAKSTASNLIAGMQIALSEPIRIDDVVIVQGEWGKIEEITSTFVVIRIWDERRLVVPLSFFIEQPFQNWTRKTSDLLGTTFLYVDYSVPVEPLRAELTRIVSASPLWDKRVCGLQVTNLSERTMELRCLVREKMIEYLRVHYPDALPTLRVQMQPSAMQPGATQPGTMQPGTMQPGEHKPPASPGDLPA